MTPSPPPSEMDPLPSVSEPESPSSSGGTSSNSPQTTHTTPVAGPQNTVLEIPSPLRLTRLGSYRLIRELGSGGMGIVYEAREDHTDRPVAIKVLRPNLPDAQAGRERFLREAKAMASLSNDHIVPVYAVGEEHSTPFMVMPLLIGETLESYLEKHPLLPPAEIARIGKEIALGLEAAHRAGLIHRDVKPSNVWLEAPNHRVKLLDFGLALASNSPNLTISGFVIGTPSYMSPEQSRGEPLDGRCDLFSLGVILYQAATGQKAFDGPNPGTVMRNLELYHPPRPDLINPEIPPHLSDLIMLLMSKDRRQRPATAEAVAERLGALQFGRATRVPIAPIPTTPLPDTSSLYHSFGAQPNAKTVQSEVYRPRPSQAPAVVAPESSPSSMNEVKTSTNLPVSAPPPEPPPQPHAAESIRPSLPTSASSSAISAISSTSSLAANSSSSSIISRTDPLMDDSQKPSSTRLIVLSFIAIAAFGTFFWNYTNKGQVTIVTDDPSAVVEFRLDGVLTEVSETERELTLKSGEYDLSLKKGTTGLKLSKDKIRVTRGSQETIRVNKSQ